MAKDQTSAHNTITVEKFAKRIAATVCRFLDQLGVSPTALKSIAVTVVLTVRTF
jgi:hypothetical protein